MEITLPSAQLALPKEATSLPVLAGCTGQSALGFRGTNDLWSLARAYADLNELLL